MSDTYQDGYTDSYGDNAEVGYVVPHASAGAVYGFEASGQATVMSGVLGRNQIPVQRLWARVQLSTLPTVYGYRNGAWEIVAEPVDYTQFDRVVGGRQDEVTLTDLNDMVSDGVITTEQKNQAIIDAGGTP